MTTLRPSPVRVLIADDHRLFAEALQAILSTEERITVVGRAADGFEAVELARTLRPDVVALDLSMPVMDGFEAAAALEKARVAAGGPDPHRIEFAAGHRPRPPGRREGVRHEGLDRRQPRRGDPRGRRVITPLLPFSLR